MKIYKLARNSQRCFPIVDEKRQYEVTSTDVNIVDLPYNLNS